MNARLTSQKYAVVDLETTSAGTDAKIIQVGIVLVQNGQILETYETDVNPHQPLSQTIINLTGIKDEQLATAPDFSQVAAKIYQLLEGTVFVAHNVRFDANLLAEALFFEGFELRNERVDTVELSQVFFPTEERYSLSSLSKALGIPLQDAHTALADARATAELFLHLQKKIYHLPKVTVQKILSFSDQLIYETGQVIEEIYRQMPDKPLLGYIKVLDLVLLPTELYRKDRRLSQEFSHNIALLGLDERKAQAMFSDLLAQHLQDEQVNFIQAQAGIGKTYAYLLTLLAHTNQRIVVATPTKVLQEQIMQSEGQAIAQTFHINFHSLKGYENYIKLDSFWESLSHQDENRLANRHKMQILVWLTETSTGDLDEIKQRQIYHPYFDSIRHDGHLLKTSFFYEEDFWYRSYRLSKTSRVVITNQPYLLTRLEDDSAFLEDKILVIDEAQKLFLNLENLSRQSIKIGELLAEVRSQHSQSDNLLTKRILESLQFRLEVLEHQSIEGEVSLKREEVEEMRQNLGELEKGMLPQLETLLSSVYQEFWLSSERHEEKSERYIQAARWDFLEFAKLLPPTCKAFCISASLTISKKVDLPHLLGFKEEEVSFDIVDQQSSTNQAIWLPNDLPAIAELSETAYADFLTDKILALAQLGTPLLILFNANHLLGQVSDRLKSAGLAHLAQHLNGSAVNVKRRFESGEAQVLLGSGAFWEGVDFSNQSKLILVLSRLPFDRPDDHFVQKVNQRLKREGKNPFYDYQLPLTILKVQQAIGRTRRNQDQQSAVLVLDNRILNKAYGKKIRRALEGMCWVTETDFASSLTDIGSFLG